MEDTCTLKSNNGEVQTEVKDANSIHILSLLNHSAISEISATKKCRVRKVSACYPHQFAIEIGPTVGPYLSEQGYQLTSSLTFLKVQGQDKTVTQGYKIRFMSQYYRT